MNLLIQSSYSKFIKRGPSEKRWMVIRAIIFRRKGKRSCWTPRNYLKLFLNRMHLFTNQFQFYALSLSYQYLPFKGFNNSFNTNTIVLSDVFISKVWIILHVTRSFNTNRIVLADVFKENISIFSFLPRSETFQQQHIHLETIDDNI